MIITTEIKVLEDVIDEVGHVNNSVYVKYLENAREEWYKNATGLTFSDMGKFNFATVVVRLDIIFKKEAVLGDTLTIHTIPKKIGTKSFVFQQEIYNQQEELLTDATVTNVMFDTLERKSIPVITDIKKNFNNK